MNDIKVIADVSRYIGDWNLNVGHVDGEVSILINRKQNTLKYTLHNNKSLLHLMATNREESEHSDLYLEIAKFLIKEKREGYVNRSDNYGETPLHVAAGYGDLDMIMLLISNGGDVTIKNDSNSTPIDNNQSRMNDKLYGLSNSERERNTDPNDQAISDILEIGKLRVESMRRKLDERPMPLEGLNFTEMKRSLKKREPTHQTLAFSSLLNSRLAEDSISGINELPIEVFDMIAKSLKEEQNTKRGGKVSQRNKSRSRRKKRTNRKRNSRKRTNKKRTNRKLK